MKKILLILCLFMIVGCSSKVINTDPNAVNSLDVLNERTHGRICKPGVTGVSDEEFAVIEEKEGLIGEYKFKVNDVQYIIRFSDTILPGDITGQKVDGKPVFEEDYNDVRASGNGLKMARWFTTDGQYVIMVPDNLDDDIYNSVTNEMASLTVPEQ